MTVRERLNREEIVRRIESRGVQTRILFSGNFIRHPYFEAIRGTDAYHVVGELNHTDRIMRDTFWVGVYLGMAQIMLAYIVETIIEAVKRT